MQKYTREYFATSDNSKQKEALKNIKRGTFTELNKEVPLSKSVFNYDVLIGSKEDAIKKFNNLSKSDSNKKECDLINKFGGIENLFDIVDEDGDGIISGSELSDISAVDTADEWAIKKNATLSANDLCKLYNNLIASDGVIVEENGNKTVYKYKDNLETTITKDKNGKVIKQKDEKVSKNNERTVTLYDFVNERRTKRVYNSENNIILEDINNKGTIEDRKSEVYYDKNGDKRTVFESIGQKVEWTENKNGNVTSFKRDLKFESDGVVENSSQNDIGNCWLLATVNALKDMPKGSQIIKESIQQNKDGSVTVTLKGVGKSYTYSPERVGAKEYDDTGRVYSSGDIDMKLIELAVKDYRLEVIKANDREYIDKNLSKKASLEDPLRAGGFTEPIKYLTGLDAITHSNFENKNKSVSLKSKNPNRYILTVTFKNKDSSLGIYKSSNSPKITTGHMYNVSRVTNNTVYVVNPWDSSEEIAYPKNEFLDNSYFLAITDLDKYS